MIYNLSKQVYIAKQVFFARSLFSRSRGMIGRRFDGFDAMVFYKCNAIHTMFMGMNLDVLFVNNENKVCFLCEKLVPWRVMVRCAEAVTVVELPEGVIAATGTAVGDVLALGNENIEKLSNIEKQLLPGQEAVVQMTSDGNK